MCDTLDQDWYILGMGLNAIYSPKNNEELVNKENSLLK